MHMYTLHLNYPQLSLFSAGSCYGQQWGLLSVAVTYMMKLVRVIILEQADRNLKYFRTVFSVSGCGGFVFSLALLP